MLVNDYMLEEIEASNLLGTIINPLSGYFICNHFIGDELTSGFDGYRERINLPLGVNNLLVNQNMESIKQYDIVLCQVDFFESFVSNILPKLRNKIILITSQWAYPAIERSEKTDMVLEHPNILLWISQNPIYANQPKYMPFPHGINMASLPPYYTFLLENNMEYNKSHIIKSLPLTVKDWYPEEHIRKRYPIFGKDSGEGLSYDSYLRELSTCKYIISPEGDRPDCYRNYEAIGLGTIPVSNIEEERFEEIFGTNMVYSDAESMSCMVTMERDYVEPNRRIILLDYWIKHIIAKIKSLT